MKKQNAVTMKSDFIIHWIWSICFAILLLSGIAMIGARFGWVLGYDIAAADMIHRVAAVVYIGLAAASIAQESTRAWFQQSEKLLTWGIFSRQGYGLFTLLTTVLFILSGWILWKNHDTNRAAVAVAMFIHEQLTYITLASVIWHIYQKAHILVLPKQPIPVNVMTQTWFKAFVWFISTAYFFCLAAMIIGIASPSPSGQAVKKFMAGMMQAMDQSLMGVAAMETGGSAGEMLSGYLLVQLLIIAIIFGAWLVWRKSANESR